MKIGVVGFTTVDNGIANGNVAAYMDEITPLYDKCVEEGARFVVAYIHWNWNGNAPVQWAKDFASELAECGFGAVIGSCGHTLQEMEYVDSVPVFYSLGNFCYGGNSNPDDKDSAIVQIKLKAEEDESLEAEFSVIPCALSGKTDYNDFSPVSYKEGSDGYKRVMEKLKFENE